MGSVFPDLNLKPLLFSGCWFISVSLSSTSVLKCLLEGESDVHNQSRKDMGGQAASLDVRVLGDSCV